MTKLSHSAVSKYAMCPKSYEYHYIHRLRPTTTSAALLFGTAIDAAIGQLLKPTTKQTPYEVFIDKWSEGYVNNVKVLLRDNTDIVYAKKDFDADLLTESQLMKLTEEFNVDDPLAYYYQILEQKETIGFDKLTEAERGFFNTVNWECTLVKGPLLIQAYQEKILPQIEKVHAVQEEVEFENDDGDTIIGYVDLFVRWKDIGDVVLDNKTSARRYDNDSVRSASQLVLYAEGLDCMWAGFIVMMKSILKVKNKECSVCKFNGSESRAKTCPVENNGKRCAGAWNETVTLKGDIQIVLDKISEHSKKMVVENYAEINRGIKNEVFPRNLTKCNDFFGGQCPYFNKCWNNKDDGLKKVDK